MAATSIATLRTAVRLALRETTAKFWSDAELDAFTSNGIIDLWGAILDVHAEHFLTVDTTHVTMASGSDTLTGVPSDCFRVQMIEPLDTTSTASGAGISFTPRKYKSDAFAQARSVGTLDVSGGGNILYAVSNVGAPIAAPTIYVAPKLSSTLALRFCYNPIVAIATDNPIPGGSDNALINWTLAYALAKESPTGNVPDAGRLSVYATEKAMILTRITPRQEQEPEYVDGLFEESLN